MNWKPAVFVLALAGCSGPDAAETPAAPGDPAPAETLTSAPPPASAAEPATVYLQPGRYCYFRTDANNTEGLDLSVLSDGQMSGQHFGTIHNAEAGYYAAFQTDLSEGETGPLGRVSFETFTQVDGDEQSGAETWVITPTFAHLENFSDAALTDAECAGLRLLVWPPVEE